METACVDGHSRISVVIDPGHIRTHLYLYDKGKGVCVRDVCAIYDNNISPSLLTLWQAERHFCHLRFTGAATILSFFRSILLAWILLAKLSVNVQ